LLTEWIVNCAQKMKAHRDWRTALDAAIGDVTTGSTWSVGSTRSAPGWPGTGGGVRGPSASWWA
jgi:hypothetical protein